MLHERKRSKKVVIDGPLTKCVAVVRVITLEQVLERAPSSWYLEDQEAKNLGLVEAIQ
jgi:hypothetical protein